MRIVLIIVALLIALPSLAQAPKTNGERGMLKYNDAFVSPKPILCEYIAYKQNKMFKLNAVFLSDCDFKAKWARRHNNR